MLIKLRIPLFLALVLLQLQFGITLLHHHHDNSYYDHKDPTHHICADTPTATKRCVAGPFSCSPVLPAAAPRVAAPDRLILGQDRPEPTRITAYPPIASFPNRASPA